MTYAAERRILDADSHIMELPGWLEEHADPADRDKLRPLHLGAAGAMAQQAVDAAVARRGDAEAAARLEGALMKAKGWSALGAFDPAERSRALDLLGFQSQMVFATFATTQFSGHDPEVLWAGTRAHNRAMGEWCGQDQRLVGVAWIPLNDPARALEAVEDALRFGCGALHVPSVPARGSKGPTHPDFDPLWARAQDAGVPIVLHLGGQGRMIPAEFHDNGRPVTDLLGGGENVRAKDVMAMHVGPEVFASAFILDGIFDRFPRLMLGIIEQGGEWVVPWLARLDRTQRSFAKTEPTIRDLELKASDYVRRNIRVTPFVGERVGWMIEQAGEEIFLFSSDYPHPEGSRDPIGHFESTMDGVSGEARERFYWRNTAELLGAGATV